MRKRPSPFLFTVLAGGLAGGLASGAGVLAVSAPAWAESPSRSQVAPTAQILQTTPTDGPILTVYQNGQTLVIDSRRLVPSSSNGGQGMAQIAFDGVAAGLIPASVQISLEGQKDAHVIQQRYQPAVDEHQMLRAMVGKTVTILTPQENGPALRRTMTVVRADPSPMLQDSQGVLFSIPGALEFSSLPAHLSATPRLSAMVSGLDAAKDSTATLRYLTSGLSWGADHVISLDANAQRLTLTTWATLTNNSGTVWNNARLALMAGTVNREPMVMQEAMPRATMAAQGAVMDKMTPQAEAVGGYYLYPLPQRVSLADGETRQVALGDAQQLDAEIHYEIYQQTAYHRAIPRKETSSARMILRFETPTDGQPLPAGTMRVYSAPREAAQGQTASSHSAQGVFLGAGGVPATPAGEDVRLPLGEAFDVTASQRQTAFRQISERVTQASYEVVLSNAQDHDIVVEVVANLSGDWSITEETQDHTQDDAGSVRWHIPVPAGGSETLSYGVRTAY